MPEMRNIPRKIHLLRLAVSSCAAAMLLSVAACGGEKEHIAPPVNENDSLPFMHSRGISNLISDSGVIRYKVVAEEWDIYNNTQPPKWVFIKGILLEKFDSTFHMDWFVQSDTAYCYNQRLWELRGRVLVRNLQGTIFRTEELFWDMSDHEIYSHQFVDISMPDKELKAYNFTSNEQMTRYTFNNAQGFMPFNDSEDSADSVRTAPAKP